MPVFKTFQPLSRAMGGDRRKMLLSAILDTAQAGHKVQQLAMRDPELYATLADMSHRRNQLLDRIDNLDGIIYADNGVYSDTSRDLAYRVQQRLLSDAENLDNAYFGLQNAIVENPYMYVKDPAVRNSPEFMRANANLTVARNFENSMRAHPDFNVYRAIPPLAAGGGAAAVFAPGEAQASTWAPPDEPGVTSPAWYADPVELITGGIAAMPLRMLAPVARTVGTGVGAFTDMMLDAASEATPGYYPEEYYDLPQ